MKPRNGAWWSFVYFYEGVLEEMKDDPPLLDELSNTDRKGLLDSLQRSKSYIATIEELFARTEVPF